MATSTPPVTPQVIPILPPVIGEPADYNTNYILFWNNVALDLNRLTTSLYNGPGNSPPSTTKFLSILHLAIHDTYFSIHPDATGKIKTYLNPNDSNPNTKLPALVQATDAEQAVAGASITVLNQVYSVQSPTIPFNTTNQLQNLLAQHIAEVPHIDALSPSYRFGIAVAKATLALLDQGLAPFDQGNYRPNPGQYKFDDDPTNPIRIVPVDPNNPNGPQKAIRVYAAPFYGLTGKRIAVQGKVNNKPVEHIIADPPVGFSNHDQASYDFSVREVYHAGGAPGLNTTTRTPSQTEIGYFWAYDGSNLIGTPPRNYNQLLRRLAVSKRPDPDLRSEKNNADFARLFALANAAMGDAGIFAWEEKYCFEFWRPLAGVRQDLTNPLHDPFWLTLSAPETNTNQINFKPPFPSYPSGHATFGGAFFQMLRLYYKARDNLTFADDEADTISFSASSDELNGVSRDLRQPYDPNVPIQNQLGTVRTNIGLRKFNSLWEAMWENGISRIFLGVHWGFDAFAAKDVVLKDDVANGTVVYKDPKDIKYTSMGARGDRPGKGAIYPFGGVPLGIGIANDIFQGALKPTPSNLQPSGRLKCGDPIPAPAATAEPQAQTAEGDAKPLVTGL